MAESTFGRRAVNDGKLGHRLREGKRVAIDTLERIQAYMVASMPGGMQPPSEAMGSLRSGALQRCEDWNLSQAKKHLQKLG
jgi:hypothetical protein